MIIDTPFDFVDIGFNTQVRKWMLEFYNVTGMQTMNFTVSKVEIKKASGHQFEFKNPMMGGKPIWHVRERYFKSEIDSLEITNEVATINGKNPFKPYTVPDNWQYIRYNYSINHAICKIFFLDKNHNQIGEECIRRHVMVDNLDHETFDGNYPKIFLEASRDEVKDVIITDSYVIVSGYPVQTVPVDPLIPGPLETGDTGHGPAKYKIKDKKK